MASTGLQLDPLSSKDGTPVDVVKSQNIGRAQVADDPVLEQLTRIADTLDSINWILSMEFEIDTEELSDGED